MSHANTSLKEQFRRLYKRVNAEGIQHNYDRPMARIEMMKFVREHGRETCDRFEAEILAEERR